MAHKPLSEKIVDEYHNFDIWRQITNIISTEVGDLNNLPDELDAAYRKSLEDLGQTVVGTEHVSDLTTAVKETYNSTQARLRHILIKTLGMS